MLRSLCNNKTVNYIFRPYSLSKNTRNNSIKMNRNEMISLIKRSIPPLNSHRHKGQAGRIGIIGGSLEYTGAPYFAGISALKVGADLVHIFCTSPAATVIKSYSPELIVHPILDQAQDIKEITTWFDRLHVIVIGPGLGRDKDTFTVVSQLITIIREKKIPLVIDADGLFLITENPVLLNNFSSPVVLTPNKIEYERLSKKQQDLSQLGANITILKKGETDELISKAPDVQWRDYEGGSGRRCGGQGDLLSGSIATFLNWTLADEFNSKLIASSLACYAASLLVRRCNEKAFALKGRSMLATDMIEQIHEAFEELFGK